MWPVSSANKIAMKTQRPKRILSFLPYKHVVISTSLSLDQAVELIASSISPAFSPILNPLPNAKKYQGEVSEQGFKIRVTDNYRGSLTYIKGKFISTTTGVKIDMYVDPNPIFLLSPLIVGAAFCSLLEAIADGNFILIIGSTFFIIFFGLGHFIETESLDWFMGNLIGTYLLENKQ